MRIKTRIYRIFRNKVKGPVFSVFIMTVMIYTLTLIRDVVDRRALGFAYNQRDRHYFEPENGFRNLEGAKELLYDHQLQQEQFVEAMDNSPAELDTVLDEEISDSSQDERTCDTHVMFLAESQLGNLMAKYSVLYGLRQRFNISVYLFPKQHRFASSIFANLSIGVIPDRLKRSDWRPVDYSALLNMLPCDVGAELNRFLVITDWPADNGLAVYHDYLPQLRAEFRFVDSVRLRAQRFADQQRFDVDRQDKRGAATLVGIHVRRGDHRLHTWLLHSRRLPSADYLAASMRYFTAIYGDSVRFLVATDDRAYVQTHLLEAGRAGAGIPAPDMVLSENIGQHHDMALLAACDHVVVTVGTFGLFSAILAGGSIVSPAKQPGIRDDPFDLQVHPSWNVTQLFSWN